MKHANVFWLVKDWKESWDAKDMQGLLNQAQIDDSNRCVALLNLVFHDVPSNAFCDEDTIALGPRDMRCDVKTAELLHDLSTLDVGETGAGCVLADADVHWDGSTFWLRVPESYRKEINLASESALRTRLLAIIDQWVKEEDWLALVELQEA